MMQKILTMSSLGKNLSSPILGCRSFLEETIFRCMCYGCKTIFWVSLKKHDVCWAMHMQMLRMDSDMCLVTYKLQYVVAKVEIIVIMFGTITPAANKQTTKQCYLVI